MKLYVLITLVGFHSLALSHAEAQTDAANNSIKGTGRREYPSTATASEIVSWVESQSGIPIYFVEKPYGDKERITVKQRIDILSSKAPLSDLEQDRLSSDLSTVKAGKYGPNDLVYFKKEYPFDRNNLNTVDAIKGLHALATDYDVSQNGASIFVISRSAGTPDKFQFRASGEGNSVLESLVSKILEPRKISLLIHDPLFTDKLAKSNIKLDLSDVDMQTCLTRFTQTLGSDVVWSLSGPDQFRHLEFHVLRKPATQILRENLLSMLSH